MSDQAKIRIVRVTAEEISRAKSNASSARSTLEKPAGRRRVARQKVKLATVTSPEKATTPSGSKKVRRRKTTAETNRPPNTVPMWKVLIGGKVYLMDSVNRVFTFNEEHPVELGIYDLTNKVMT